MLSFSYNISERCYLEVAKKTLDAADDKEFCQKIDVRYSYGKVSNEEYRKHYDSDFWLSRKVSWILSVPFRLICAIFAIAEAAIDLGRGDHISSKINLFSTVRLLEY